MKFTFLITLILALTSCLEQESSAHASSSATPNEPSLALLPEKICKNKQFPSITSLKNHATAYEEVCDLSTLDGVVTDRGSSFYLCRTEMLNAEFPDIKPRFDSQKVQKFFGEYAQKANLIQWAGFMGRKFGMLLQVQNDQLEQIIATHDQLKSQAITLQTAEAGLAWAYLSGALGRSMNNGFAPEALCGASLEATNEGWSLTNASVFQNCQPKEIRDLIIARNGKVTITNTIISNEPALCID